MQSQTMDLKISIIYKNVTKNETKHYVAFLKQNSSQPQIVGSEERRETENRATIRFCH